MSMHKSQTLETMLAILNYNKPCVLRNPLRTLVGHCKKIHTLLHIVQMIDGDTWPIEEIK